MNKTVGFIGAGKMASAIIKGLISSGLFSGDRIMAAEINTINAQKAENELGIKTTPEAEDVVKQSDIIDIATNDIMHDSSSNVKSLFTEKKPTKTFFKRHLLKLMQIQSQIILTLADNT